MNLTYTYIHFQAFQWADIYVHNPSMAEYCYYNSFRGAVEVYDTDELSTAYEENVLIKTPTVKVNSEVLRAFLRAEDRPLFLLVGLSGSGKRLIDNFSFLSYPHTTVLRFFMYIAAFCYTISYQNSQAINS